MLSLSSTFLRRKWLIGIVLFLAALIIAARIYLGVWLLDHVNRVLAHIEGYEGSVKSIEIDLYRGAYRVHDLKINKVEGSIPTPFVDIELMEFSLQWSALFHGRIVSSATLLHPVINFAVSKTAKQTGTEVDWTKPIKKLMPIDIDSVDFRDGKLTFQDFSTTPKANVYIHHMHGIVRNLRNIEENGKLPSTIEVKGDSIGKGTLDLKGRMNILKEIPDMDILAQLENVHLPALSNFSNAYASFDFKDGNFNLYSEIIVKNDHVSGYIKPMATHISIVDLRDASNPIKLAWESVVSLVIEIFTNHSKDQFATKVALEGNLEDIHSNTWSAIAGILHNAFIGALKKGLDYNGKKGLAPQAKDLDHAKKL